MKEKLSDKCRHLIHFPFIHFPTKAQLIGRINEALNPTVKIEDTNYLLELSLGPLTEMLAEKINNKKF